MKISKNKGISLIILVITIIIIIILAGAVILSLVNENPINSASKAIFIGDVRTFQSELLLYQSKQFVDKLGAYYPKTLQADGSSVTYNGVVDYNKSIKDIIKTLDQNNKYDGMFEIVDGELVFAGSDTNKKEWLDDIGLDVINEPVDETSPENPVMSINPSGSTNVDVTVTIIYSSDSTTKEYSLDGINWIKYTLPIVITENNTTVYAKGKDSAGNESGVATTTITNIDKNVPTVAFGTNGGSGVSASTTVTINDIGGSNINISTLQYVWDTQNVTTPISGWSVFTNGATLTKTGDGTYYLWIKANDNAGNNLITKTNAFILTYVEQIVTTVQPVNKTFTGATTGFSYNNPVIPAGFVAVNTGDASWNNLSTDWNKGVVIQDSYANQFVWIPVDGTNVPYAKWGTTAYAYNDPNISDDTLPTGIASETNQITIYKGFYIARYEAMFDYNSGNIRAASKKSLNKTTTNWVSTRDNAHTGYLWNYIRYPDAKSYSLNMATSYGYDTTKVVTNLITGTQWDTVMRWIQNSGKSVTDSIAWGNYSNSAAPANIAGYGNLQISGFSNCWKANNIYDIAGNTYEWTNEKYTPTNYMNRSGSYSNDGTNVPANYRRWSYEVTELYYLSFRVALFVK